MNFRSYQEEPVSGSLMPHTVNSFMKDQHKANNVPFCLSQRSANFFLRVGPSSNTGSLAQLPISQGPRKGKRKTQVTIADHVPFPAIFRSDTSSVPQAQLSLQHEPWDWMHQNPPGMTFSQRPKSEVLAGAAGIVQGNTLRVISHSAIFIVQLIKMHILFTSFTSLAFSKPYFQKSYHSEKEKGLCKLAWLDQTLL